MNTDLIKYYAHRAREYELIYDKPERQADLDYVANYLKKTFTDQSVYEVACGTGYWTQHIAQTACSVTATDINPEVLEVAKRKAFPQQNVTFDVADIYALPAPKQPFDAGFGGFIWSHVPLVQLPDVIASFHQTIKKGGRVVWIDNRYVSESSTPIAERDDVGNTYQRRRLRSGEEHLILKNFSSEEELQNAVEDCASNIQIIRLSYFWILTYVII